MATAVAAGLVDCDIHATPASEASLRPYLAKRWRRDYIPGDVFRGRD